MFCPAPSCVALHFHVLCCPVPPCCSASPCSVIPSSSDVPCFRMPCGAFFVLQSYLALSCLTVRCPALFSLRCHALSRLLRWPALFKACLACYSLSLLARPYASLPCGPQINLPCLALLHLSNRAELPALRCTAFVCDQTFKTTCSDIWP